MYYFLAILLNDCPYSIALKDLLNSSSYKHLKVEYINVDHTTKYKYKNNIIDTFPQLYFKKTNSKENILLGGYDSFINLINATNNSLDDIKKKISNEYPTLSNKIILRLIKFLIPIR